MVISSVDQNNRSSPHDRKNFVGHLKKKFQEKIKCTFIGKISNALSQFKLSKTANGEVKDPPLKSQEFMRRYESKISEEIKVKDDPWPKDSEMSVLNTVSRTSSFYAVENHDYLKSIEIKYQPLQNYMQRQRHMDDWMRACLVDWMASLSLHLKVHQETLHLAISYLDRFLSRVEVVPDSLQLIGMAALLIAAKFEEERVDSRKLLNLTENTYSISQINEFERLILRTLRFNLAAPTSIVFLKIYCYEAGASSLVTFLAMYMCELLLMVRVPYSPSCLAAASLASAQYNLGVEVWSRKLEIFSGYKLTDLRVCIDLVDRMFKSSRNLKLSVIRKKYEDKRYRSVASIFPR